MTVRNSDVVLGWREGRYYRGGNILSDARGIYSYGPHFPLVVKNEASHLLIGNSDRRSVTTSEHQALCRIYYDYDLELPFSALYRLHINAFSDYIQILDKIEARYVESQRKLKDGSTKVVSRHFASQSLISVKSTFMDKRLILCAWDYDSAYANRPVFFAAQLPKSDRVKTIQEAFEFLKPKKVKEYEKKTDTKAKRQGEWFFIPAEPPKDAKLLLNYTFPKEDSHHQAENCIVDETNRIFVRGKITHLRKEHKQVYLSEWHEAVKNTAVISVSLGGRVD